MSRIHQILSKAERDGTMAGLTLPDLEVREAEPPVPASSPWRNEAPRAAA